jgi:hypothetical protein
MFHGHGNCFARFSAVTDEFDGFYFRLRALDELFEPSSLDEEFNSILQVDAVISSVSLALVESTIFCFVDSLPLLRWSLWWFNVSLC